MTDVERVLIGELARLVGLSANTVRYHESTGLLGDPERTDLAYRTHGPEDLERLRFIRKPGQVDKRSRKIREKEIPDERIWLRGPGELAGMRLGVGIVSDPPADPERAKEP